MPQTVSVSGILWKLYAIDFQTPDGKYSAYFYAIDDEHASYILGDIKTNGEIRSLV